MMRDRIMYNVQHPTWNFSVLLYKYKETVLRLTFNTNISPVVLLMSNLLWSGLSTNQKSVFNSLTNQKCAIPVRVNTLASEEVDNVLRSILITISGSHLG